eukprot:754490-Hanusia_phi.AAC.7
MAICNPPMGTSRRMEDCGCPFSGDEERREESHLPCSERVPPPLLPRYDLDRFPGRDPSLHSRLDRLAGSADNASYQLPYSS